MNATVHKIADHFTARSIEEEKVALAGGFPVKSNVGRNIEKLVNEFRSAVEALYEYPANGYEAYDFDARPQVDINIAKRGKDYEIEIVDSGCGMDLDGIGRFFSMHLETVRRANGRNMRGINGTGSLAAFKFGNILILSSVKNGLRNVFRLTWDEIVTASKEQRAPMVEPLVENQPTDAANGTVITIQKMKSGFKPDGDFLAALRTKIEMEMMMWMKDATILINGDACVEKVVRGDKDRGIYTAKSPCGNFELDIHYSEKGFQDELRAVFMSAGQVFLAMEQFGKEGHRFNHKVHVAARASEEWAREHFYNNRLEFMSERRDLKLKLTHPQAVAYKDFVETEVKAYMAKLEADEAARRAKELNDAQRDLEKRMSRFLSQFISSLTPKVEGDGRDRQKPDPNRIIHLRGPRQPKCMFKLSPMDNPDIDYQIEPETDAVVVNSNFHVLKALKQEVDCPIYNSVVMDLAKQATLEFLTQRRVAEYFEGYTTFTLSEVQEQATRISSELRVQMGKSSTDMYAAFAKLEAN